MRIRNQFFRLMAPDPDPDAGGAGGGGAAGGDGGAAAAAAPATADAAAAAAKAGGGKGGAGDPDPNAGADGGKGAAPAAGAKEGEGYWPADWRSQIAGGDEKLTARLARYGSPKDVANALLSVQAKIGAGEFRSVLPKDANAEQVKTWRSENGIPETPDKYDLKLEGGLVIGKDDQPLMDTIFKSLHEVHANSAVVSKVVDLYYAEAERSAAARETADQDASRAASDALHAEWGGEFRGNMNLIDGLMDTAPAGVKELFRFGRLSDGTPIMGHADTIRWLNQMAREINPVTTVIPNAGANISAAIDDEIKGIETKMRTDRKAYNADEKMQSRYRELLDAQERAKKKAA